VPFFRGIADIFRGARAGAKKLPLLLISGSADGVGGYGKLSAALAKKYAKLGYKTQYIEYEGARHEILNELERARVWADIVAFVTDAVRA
ncbi:MAG: alpha/beta hydrolase, partial [Clostridiales bacterium]|nr:alpha/beta hydrolase [Clostridiales bacterium]